MENEMKRVKRTEAATLRTLSIATFNETFEADNTVENMRAYLQAAYNLEKLEQELANPDSEFQFIFHAGKLAGYVKLNVGEAQSESQGKKALEIERIYIKQEFKRQGLGSKLLNYGIEQAQKLGKDYVWLGVWEHNNSALRFYHKMGFKQFGEHVFKMGTDLQRDLLVKRDVSAVLAESF